MKNALAAVACLSLVMIFQPAWTFECPSLVQEGRDLLAKAGLSSKKISEIKALLDGALKLHEEGEHADAVEKANQALKLLGGGSGSGYTY